jgi:hypothetical protein
MDMLDKQTSWIEILVLDLFMKKSVYMLKIIFTFYPSLPLHVDMA